MNRLFHSIIAGFGAMAVIGVLVMWITVPPLKVLYSYLEKEGFSIEDHEVLTRAVVNKNEGKFSYIEVLFKNGEVKRFELQKQEEGWEILDIEDKN